MFRRTPLRSHRPRAVLAVLGAATVLVAAHPALAARPEVAPARQAEPEPTTDEAVDLAPLGVLPELSPALAEVTLTSDGYDVADDRRRQVEADRVAAARREADEDAAIAIHTQRDAELTMQIEEARDLAEHWESEAGRLDDQVRAIAVDSYVRGHGDEASPLLELDPDVHNRQVTAALTSSSLARRQIAELEHAQSEARQARNEETLGTAIRQGVRDSLAAARVARDEARADEERLGIELLEATAAVEDERRLASVVGAEFPLVVLDAYWKAAEVMTLLAPECGISWWALAGIGKIESGHGTYAGSEVRADGSLTKPIIGIPLTGAGGTAAIGDSDGGLVDGDPTVDRAAGPMQFIPQTWAAYGVDGDQNGRIEIQNIYDAAASAARYLCAAAGSMADVGGLQRGYFAYNHSTAYVSSVLSQAVRYGTAVVIEGVPAPPAPPAPATPATPADGTTTTAPPA